LLDGIAALGLEPQALRHVIVTHIHLDHAGAAGTLLRQFPAARLYVHERGAPHMRDPTALVRSATRIYGDQMGPLWGEIVPVEPERLAVLSDGSTIDLGDRLLDVVYTPGHASHHVVLVDRASGSIFAGDVAGVRIPPSDMVSPPMPPPDVDLPAWHASIARLRALQPARLFIAHFGVVTRVAAHLDELDRTLDELVTLVETRLAAGAERDQVAAELQHHIEAQLADAAPDLEPAYALATPSGMSVDGLLRYLRTRNP
jgi:glyoxylase-like metal-dependent hydrolase (beta-lactamase superfamily II)